MPLVRKRRAPQQEQRDESEERPAARRRGRAEPEDEAEVDDAEDQDEDAEEEGAASGTSQMVKTLVRLALASEHSRTPIRRPDISAKVLNGQPRKFKAVFEAAQLALRSTFGMQLVELPPREHVTMKQRRAAQKQASNNTQSKNTVKSWILVSVLPSEYRDAAVVTPSKIPSSEDEAAYMGLYAMTVTLLAVYGAPMPEARLERAFARMNAAENTPLGRFDRLLDRMVKQGYIVRIKDNAGGEETIEYMVGPRGKKEVGNEGVAALVRKVYGEQDEGSEATEELEKRLERSLKVANLEPEEAAAAAGNEGVADARPAAGRRGRPPRGQARDADESGEDEDADSE